MASSESASRKITLKLLIDKANEKVIFAEAGKEFIDFLFHLMLLPVGTVISLLDRGMAGSLVMLHDGIENLSDAYMQPGFDKDLLLEPRAPSFNPDSSLLLLNGTTDSSASNNYYRCGYSGFSINSNCRDYVTQHHGARCPGCGNSMTSVATLVLPLGSVVSKPTSKGGDYVKELVTYMVMDDLMVKPMSTISCITLFGAFTIKDVGGLQEKVVEFGMNEGIKLLQASSRKQCCLMYFSRTKHRSKHHDSHVY